MANSMSTTVKIDDVTNGNASTSTSSVQSTPSNGSGNEAPFLASEVLGDPPVDNGGGTKGESGSDDEEFENSGGESGTEAFETATAEALTKTFSNSAFNDFGAIAGFDPLFQTEAGEASDIELTDAGSALGGATVAASEEFGFLAALVPTLLSTVGPSIAKAVIPKLSKRTVGIVTRLAKSAPKVAKVSKKSVKLQAQLPSLLAKLLESAEAMPGSETNPSLDDALVESIASALEVVIGQDDRVHIQATHNIPWRRICALRITFPTGKLYRGTGFFIGPRAVATAGHCVYLHDQGGWARSVEVIPAANGASQPYGTVNATQFRSVGGWVNNRKPDYDYGCVVIPRGSFNGRNLGQFGFGALSSSDLLSTPAVLAGYPGDKPFAELWGMARRIKTVAPERLIYDIDTVGGQSGAPVYIMHQGERVVVGIHNYGNSGGNSATRITQQVYRHLENWRKFA